MEVEMEVVQSNNQPIIKTEPEEVPVKIEVKEEIEDIFAEAEGFTASSGNPQSNEAVIVQENDEEIDIEGTSDNEEASSAFLSSNNSTGTPRNRNKVSFLHPADVLFPTSSITQPPPTRVVIPERVVQKRIAQKQPVKTKTKYVKDGKKKDMAFNTQEYNYMDDELFFKREEIPLPFEDVRMYEHDIDSRPAGEQRYIVDAITNAFHILQQEARRIQGQLRALNARSGRIRKQIDREEEAIARGEDPTEVPRSSKGLLEGEVYIPPPRPPPVKAPISRPQPPRPQSSIQKRKKKRIIKKKSGNRSGNGKASAAGAASKIKLAATPNVGTNVHGC